MQYFTSASAIKIWGNSKHESLETKGNHLADISAGMLPLKGPTAVKPLSWSTRIFLQMVIQKNYLEKPNSWPQKRKKKKNWKFSNCLIKRESSGLNQIIIQFY